MKYMALDAHAEFCVLSVRNSSMEEIENKRVLTRAPDLIEAVKAHRGPKSLAVEESNIAGWLKVILEPHVTRFIVCNPKKNRSIADAEEKGDAIDARELSFLLGMGYLKEVHHPVEENQRFKDLVLHRDRLSQSVARIKNQINAKWRERGQRCQGYKRRADLGELHPLKRQEFEDLYSLLDAAETVKDRAEERLLTEARKRIQICRFTKVPGIGYIHGATFYAIVDTPWRFKGRSKLWTYCGLGLKERESGGRVYRQKRNQEFNRYLKAAVMRAASTAACTKSDNRYKTKYQRLIANGVDYREAQVIVARSIVSTLWGMWRSGQVYDPDR